MDALTFLISPGDLALCFGIAVFAGVIKGLVGFALPLILISGMGSVIDPELALAGLLFPTLLSNLWQAFRQGIGAAVGSLKSFLPFLAVGGVMLVISAQMVRVIPANAMFLLIGVPVVLFTALQLMGWRPLLGEGQRVKAQLARGQRIRAILAQGQHHPQSLAQEVALVLAAQTGALDAVPVARIAEYRGRIPDLLKSVPEAAGIGEGNLDDATRAALAKALAALAAEFAADAAPEAAKGSSA